MVGLGRHVGIVWVLNGMKSRVGRLTSLTDDVEESFTDCCACLVLRLTLVVALITSVERPEVDDPSIGVNKHAVILVLNRTLTSVLYWVSES